MKKIFTLLAVIILMAQVWAQSPQKMSYQAVIRDGSNKVVTSQVGMKISILQGAANGTVVFEETQTITPNLNGLISVEIGAGTPLTGTIAAIDWSAGPYYIKTETDPLGGTSYTIEGATQILSVPYALYAKTAETTGSGTGSLMHYIGELYGGGIIVSVWKKDGVEHGLIASLTDLSIGTIWSNISLESGANSAIDGVSNTNKMMLQTPSEGAGFMCSNYTNAETGTGTFDDWYLPAIWELKECYNSIFILEIILGPNGLRFDNYWSSTENNIETAWFMNFSTGITYAVGVKNNLPANSGAVRAVRKF